MEAQIPNLGTSNLVQRPQDVNEEHTLKTEDELNEDPRLMKANKLFQTGVLLIYGQRKSVDKAIKCIQKAITFNDTDYKYWQLLGEAYYQRGSLNPAINCFLKSLKLAEGDKIQNEDEHQRTIADCTYSKLRMSDIRWSVGHLDEAALGYSDIIADDPKNVAALVGLSKTKLQLARNSFSSGLVKLGHSRCMEALKYSLNAIKLSPHLCSTWKLASDCCLIQFVYGQRGQFSAKIEENFPGSEGNILIVDRKTCIELAQKFLCKALNIEPFQESCCLWHNLGISLYFKSTIVHEPEARKELLKRSIKCLLKALSLDRNNSQVKNSIGVAAFNLNLLNSAQNFIIKSIRTNLSTSEVQFSNLGYMYLQRGEFRLASVAFNRCQAEEPLYARSWLGNALVNLQNNLDNLSHLRHCHRLENNYESQMMFATKVTSLPCVEEHQKDLINALDCMKRVINYDIHSVVANNTLGLLYERCNHQNQARVCFEAALRLSPQDPRIVFNILRQFRADSSCYSLESSMNTDTDIIKSAEKLTSGSNCEYILNFIFFLFNNKDYKNVNTKMTRLIEKLPQGDVKSRISAQILLGLASKAENQDFKSWFFKNIIDLENTNCIETVINLLCLMLFGALTNDEKLIDQISNDLGKQILIYIATRAKQVASILYSEEGYWIRLAILCSIFCLKDQGKLVRPLVATFPTIAELWLYLGLVHMFQANKQQTASYCISRASLVGSTCANLGVICDILMSILTQATKIKLKPSETRAKYLSRAIYKCPNYRLLWDALKLEANATEFRSKQKRKNPLSSDENSSLFSLSIDLIIKMILL